MSGEPWIDDDPGYGGRPAPAPTAASAVALVGIETTQAVSIPTIQIEKLAALKDVLGLEKFTAGEITLYAEVANRTGLDPFAKQIYAIKRGKKVTFQTGIDGYRSIAARTGEYDGQDTEYGPRCECEEGTQTLLDDGKTIPFHPEWVKVTVWRKGMGRGVSASAFWHEYWPGPGEAVTGWANNRPTGFKVKTDKNRDDAMWLKMPRVMLAKVAEALALRKAFPYVYGGLYTEDEMAQAGPVPAEGEAAGNPPAGAGASEPAAAAPVATSAPRSAEKPAADVPVHPAEAPGASEAVTTDPSTGPGAGANSTPTSADTKAASPAAPSSTPAVRAATPTTPATATAAAGSETFEGPVKTIPDGVREVKVPWLNDEVHRKLELAITVGRSKHTIILLDDLAYAVAVMALEEHSLTEDSTVIVQGTKLELDYPNRGKLPLRKEIRDVTGLWVDGKEVLPLPPMPVATPPDKLLEVLEQSVAAEQAKRVGPGTTPTASAPPASSDAPSVSLPSAPQTPTTSAETDGTTPAPAATADLLDIAADIFSKPPVVKPTATGTEGTSFDDLVVVLTAIEAAQTRDGKPFYKVNGEGDAYQFPMIASQEDAIELGLAAGISGSTLYAVGEKVRIAGSWVANGTLVLITALEAAR